MQSQISIKKSQPNPQFFGFDDQPEPESTCLEIGKECLNFFDGDAQKAIEKFEIHKIEIILTNLHNMLAVQNSPNDSVFKQVMQFIKIEDGA